jgi:allophanate hydrolase
MDLLEIAGIQRAYATGALTPVELVAALLQRITAYADQAVFISLVPEAELLAAAAALDIRDMENLPLFGIPFAVKDNIDVAGLPTTAACPEFAYMPARDALSVARLRAAGALVLGKTNLDQFAAGLNGTRSPYGAPRNVFSTNHVSGGSSSGSGVAVAAGLAVFALGTDTAGSGRVPAAFNNIVGLKPSIGRIPVTGLVPACRSLDCITVLANSVADSMAVLAVAEGDDASDAYARPVTNTPLPAKPRFGVLPLDEREFFGDYAAASLYQDAIDQAVALGWVEQKIDYAPFREIAAALYGSALAAERVAALPEFYPAQRELMDPSVRGIFDKAAGYTAVEVFAAQQKLQALRRRAQAELARADILLLPTAPSLPSIADMKAAPVAANERLGRYTNFVNLLDLCGIAVPAGFRPNGLPFGVTLLGPVFSEAALAGLADGLHRALGAGSGQTKQRAAAQYEAPAPGLKTLVVAGAHLSGMALNHELLALGATLLSATKTAAEYQLYTLATFPPKPGLVRSPGFAGEGIEVELWSLTAAAFGEFVAALPPPMGIGKVVLADGSTHPGFLCEAYALQGAGDITAYGGWRNFRAAFVARKRVEAEASQADQAEAS